MKLIWWCSAFLGHFDLIYAVENAWLCVPFTFLGKSHTNVLGKIHFSCTAPMEGLVAEAGSSVTFVNKMGLAKANEVLLLGHKQSAQELLRINFVQ